MPLGRSKDSLFSSVPDADQEVDCATEEIEMGLARLSAIGKRVDVRAACEAHVARQLEIIRSLQQSHSISENKYFALEEQKRKVRIFALSIVA